jgi:ferredoxin-NADP reductase
MPEDLDYVAGQYFHIRIPTADVGTWIEHHFSFSTSPTEHDIAFTTRLTGHEFKDRIDALEPGTEVRVWGPDGAFVLRPEMRKVAFLCGGIGITCVRSNIRWIIDTGADVDVVLLYGNRDLEGAAFREELDALGVPNVRVVYVLSERQPGWSGPSGRIDADLVRAEVPDCADRFFFVSGPLNMVRGLRTMLIDDAGMPKQRIVTERFPGYD